MGKEDDIIYFMHINIRKQLYLFISVILFLSGCASVRHAVPPDLLSGARVSGMQDIRAFSGSPSDYFKKDLIKLFEQEEKGASSFSPFKTDHSYSMLAIQAAPRMARMARIA